MRQKSEKKLKLDKRECDGEKIRAAAMESLKRKSSGGQSASTSMTKPPKHQRTDDVTSPDEAILQSLDEANALRAKELAYNKEKLELDAKRYELDREERTARFQLERQEREIIFQALRQIIHKSD